LILYREFCSFDPKGIYNLSVPEEVNDVQNTEEVASTSDSFKAVRDWVIVLVVALVVALGIRTYVLQQFYISGPSMETTLYQPNRVLVNKLSYRLHDVNRGDVVVFDRVTSNGESIQHDDLIKRVIGLPGEKISISKCVVYVNKVALKEPYLDSRDTEQEDLNERCRQPEMAELVVPAKQVFVLGDNRPQSMDSRMFGSVDENRIVGRAFVVLWPLSRWRWL
jgi:signal peptidase I